MPAHLLTLTTEELVYLMKLLRWNNLKVKDSEVNLHQDLSLKLDEHLINTK